NYSTSYLFTSGPFQNAGFKAAYAFSDKVSLMAGIFNDNWNTYTANARTTEDGVEGEVSTFGAQLMVAPVTGWSAYVNFLTGPYSGTIIDLTTAYQITDAFKLGLNAADFSKPHDMGGYQGIALYPQFAVSSAVTLGLRGEYFKTKSYTFDDGQGEVEFASENVKAITVTANIKAGPLTFIPEVRVDSWNTEIFSKKNGDPTKSASQFVLAAVYAF
ncbi:MAG: porin, partial [Sphingobacteriaceae bacterium]